MRFLFVHYFVCMLFADTLLSSKDLCATHTAGSSGYDALASGSAGMFAGNS